MPAAVETSRRGTPAARRRLPRKSQARLRLLAHGLCGNFDGVERDGRRLENLAERRRKSFLPARESSACGNLPREKSDRTCPCRTQGCRGRRRSRADLPAQARPRVDSPRKKFDEAFVAATSLGKHVK